MELQLIRQKIHEIRGQKVMPDFDLAALYEVETRALNQARKTISTPFPGRFYVSTDAKRMAALDVTNCDVKSPTEAALSLRCTFPYKPLPLRHYT